MRISAREKPTKSQQVVTLTIIDSVIPAKRSAWRDLRTGKPVRTLIARRSFDYGLTPWAQDDNMVHIAESDLFYKLGSGIDRSFSTVGTVNNILHFSRFLLAKTAGFCYYEKERPIEICRIGRSV